MTTTELDNQPSNLNRWLVVFSSLLFSAGFACYLFTSSPPFYHYSDSEWLNVLYVKIQNGDIHFPFSSLFLKCVQHINAVMLAILHAQTWLPFSATFWLWFGQSILAAFLIYSANALYERWLGKEQSLFALFLTIFNPLVVLSLFSAPSIAISSALLLFYFSQNRNAQATRFITVLLISASGFIGFWLSLLLLVYETIQYIRQRDNNVLLESIPVIAGSLPAFSFYLFQSFLAGSPAGGALVGYPTIFTSFDPHKLMTGEWSGNAKAILVLFSNAGFGSHYWLPLFGLLSLYGTLCWLGSRDMFGKGLWTLLLHSSAFILYPFAPPEHAEAWLLPIYLIAVPAAVHGLCQISLNNPSGIRIITGSAVGTILFLCVLNLPSELERQSHHSVYRSLLIRNISDVLNDVPEAEKNSIALRFSPMLFSSLPRDLYIYPIDLTIRHKIVYEFGKQSGIRLSLLNLLPVTPRRVITYPDFGNTFDEQEAVHGLHGNTVVAHLLETKYDQCIDHQLLVSNKKEDSIISPEEVLQFASYPYSIVRQPTEEVWDGETFTDDDFFNRSRALQYGELAIDDPAWDFELDYSGTTTVGYAFGNKPSIEHSAAGLKAALSGSGNNPQKMGTIQSQPFIIEGDDLTLFANLPKAASSAVVCLAVKQKIPNNEYNVRHIFEHNPGDPLMDDVFYYIEPSELHYEPDGIYGWRVTRVLHGGDIGDGWQYAEWSLDPWRGVQAMWLAADRGADYWIGIDHVIQRKRPSGLYWNFEDNSYGEWLRWGDAFGDRPATGAFGSQTEITGFEGNYFINTFHNGSDAAKGIIESPSFTVQTGHLSFLIGGGDDIETVFVGLKMGTTYLLKETGRQSETLRRVVWDITSLYGKEVRLVLSDQSSGAWGHLLADDFQIVQSPPPLPFASNPQ